MDLFESLKRNLATRAYARFEGRASRAEFWWFVLGTFLAMTASGRQALDDRVRRIAETHEVFRERLIDTGQVFEFRASPMPDGGVVVTAAEGVAERAGLDEGDVLLQLNNVSIKDAKQFNALVAKLDPKQASVVLVLREGTTRFISLRPTAK